MINLYNTKDSDKNKVTLELANARLLINVAKKTVSQVFVV